MEMSQTDLTASCADGGTGLLHILFSRAQHNNRALRLQLSEGTG